MKLLSPRGHAALSLVCALFVSNAHAIPVSIVGAFADPEQSGVLPIVPTPPQLLDPAAVLAISDGNNATGFSFRSSAGEYSSSPLSTVGVAMGFDFDISQFETIDSIDFTWVGHYELSDRFFDAGGSDLWLTAGNGYLARYFLNSNDLGTDVLRSYSATWNRTPEGTGGTVEALLHGDIARVFVQTSFGFTDDGLDHPVLSYLQLDTREVSLNVNGTLRTHSVPTPGPLPLLATGLVLVALLRRRSTSL